MLKRVLVFLIPIMLFIALFLKVNGVDKVEFGESYYTFMRSVLERNQAFTIAIPNIPLIPALKTTSTNFFTDIVKVFIFFVNGTANTFNVLINLMNTLISCLTFLINILVQGIDNLRKLIVA